MSPKRIEEYTEEELFEELKRRRTARGRKTAKTLWDIEEQVEQTQARDYRAFVEAFVSEPENEDPKPCPRCGQLTRVRAKGRARRVRTVGGDVEYRRNYHYCEDCQEGFYPKDQELGLPPLGELSPKMEAKVLDFGVNTPYEESASRWKVHYAVAISETLVRQVVERVGTPWEDSTAQERQERLGQAEKPTSAFLVIQTDGSMLSTRDAGWKEAKVAVIYREEHHTQGEEGLRGLVSEARYLATMRGQNDLEEELQRALQQERAEWTKRVIFLGDGALGNWTLAEAVAPKAIQVLDVMHAIEHGMECGKAILGEDPMLLLLWEKRLKQLLLEGCPEELLSELEACLLGSRGANKKALLAFHRYCSTNQGRMKYREYREGGYPIGSGTVESAHRHVLQTRMKRAGQHWNHPKAHQMASLRAAYKTVGPERFYETVRLAA